MKKFKIGDELLCISEPLNDITVKLGDIITVNEVAYCIKCGSQSINVGPCRYAANRCLCGCRTSKDSIRWYGSIRFILLDNLEKEMQEAVENENYDKAIILRDLKIIEHA